MGPWAPHFPGKLGAQCKVPERAQSWLWEGCPGLLGCGSSLKGSQLPEPKASVPSNHTGPRALPAGQPQAAGLKGLILTATPGTPGWAQGWVWLSWLMAGPGG